MESRKEKRNSKMARNHINTTLVVYQTIVLPFRANPAFVVLSVSQRCEGYLPIKNTFP